MKNKLSAQLWSVRKDTAKDFFGTLKLLSEMGYTGVEFAGYGDISAKEMKKQLNDLNLSAISAHVGLDIMKANLDSEIEYLNCVGAKYIVCPSAPITTVESAKEHAEIFSGIGEKCLKAGLVFAYHNHDFELKLDDGQYPLDVLFDNADSKYVKQQPDVFWVAYAGLDVNQYILKNVDRCPIIHLKQIENLETKANVDAGSGIIDFKYIYDVAKDAELVYEQEQFVGTSLENMKKSYDFIVQSINN